MWQITPDQQCIYRVAAPLSGSIYAFDLDWTLIAPEGKRIRPKNHADWRWLDRVTETLRQKHEQGKNIVIFTNQSSCNTTEKLESYAKDKMDALLSSLGVPVSVFVAGGYSRYRKPKTKMWDIYLHATGITPDHRSLYVGDGAGRPTDYTNADRKFAINAGVRYQTPEEFFFGELEDADYALGINLHDIALSAATPAPVPFPDTTEVLVMVGAPGSGKSTWCAAHLPSSYDVVSQDVLKTKVKCLAALKRALAEGRSVVVDNTNRSASVRKPYIDASLNAGVSVRCVYINTHPDLAEHLNALRMDHPHVAKDRVPPVAIRMYASAFEPPSVDEGFVSVIEVPFIFNDSVCPQALFTQYHV